jgi:hypothetical protein
MKTEDEMRGDQVDDLTEEEEKILDNVMERLKKGELEDEEYRALSVTKAGAEGEMLEDIAEEKKNKENNTNDALDLILGESSDSMSLDDLINIVKGA